jgi:hypothetical protein
MMVQIPQRYGYPRRKIEWNPRYLAVEDDAIAWAWWDQVDSRFVGIGQKKRLPMHFSSRVTHR